MLAAIAALDFSEQGSDSLASLLNGSFVLIGVGFAIGVLGHLSGIRGLVALGIVVVMAGGGMFLVAALQFG
jgi:hypothetical protein